MTVETKLQEQDELKHGGRKPRSTAAINFNVRLTTEQRSQLQLVAHRKGTHVSYVMRAALKQYLARELAS